MFSQLKNTFNSTTVRGRANVAKATYATIALIYLFIRMRRKKTQTITSECQKNCPVCPGAEAGENSGAAVVGATAGAASGAAAASIAKAAGSDGAKSATAAKITGKIPDSSKTEAEKNNATAGEEPIKPCKRVEPKDMSPLQGRI